ncbi:MAG: ABC transporter permease [Flavobacteriaceae bacterium]|nr:ABC transporter permease [Flavobacteriaceae bacterium]
MILTILKKDLQLFFSDKKGVLLTFLLPIVLISLFTFAFGGMGGSSSKSKPIELLLADLDQTTASKNIIARLDTLASLHLVSTEITKGEELIKKGKAVGILIFEKGFQKAINSGGQLPMELKYDAAREIEMGMIQSVLMQELMSNIGETRMNTYLDNNFSGLSKQMKSKIVTDINTGNTTKNTMELKMTAMVKEDIKKGNIGLIQAVAGTAIMMLLFSITTIGGGLLDEKEAGTLKRLLYAPVKPTDILFAKMGTALVLSILQLVVMLIFAWLAFGLLIFKDIPSLVILVLSIAFAVSSFGIFLVAVAKTRQQLQGLSTIIILLMSAIGGSMIPLFVMPAIMQKIAVVSLNYWGIQGFFDIFWRNLPLIDILPKIGVLLVIGLVMTLISIRLFKKNMLKLG